MVRQCFESYFDSDIPDRRIKPYGCAFGNLRIKYLITLGFWMPFCPKVDTGWGDLLVQSIAHLYSGNTRKSASVGGIEIRRALGDHHSRVGPHNDGQKDFRTEV